jgi:hypothetical protein
MKVEARGGHTIGDVALYLLVVWTWVFGFALAKGFWSSLLAAFFPPWAWVIVAEFILQLIGR